MPHSDLHLAKKYTSKSQRAKDLGHQFEISFSTFKKCRTRKTCGLSGLPMTMENSSIDRIDNRIGYLEGNVIGCREDINQMKGQIESYIGQTPGLDWYKVQKIVNNVIKHLEK